MEKLRKILKDPQVWGFFVAVAVMAVISLAFFYPDNFEGNSLRQPDMQQGAANGHEGLVYEQATGEKALWTNSLFGGMPTFQISPSYPSNALFTWINAVYGLGLPAPSNLLFMMMFGFLILMYALGKRWYYGLMGAVAWGLSSYFIIIIGAGHIWKFVTLAYVPPTIAGLLLLYRGRRVAGTAVTALFAMLQLNANHPQMSYYFGILMTIIAICYLIDAIRRHTLRRWLAATGLALGAGILALGANAPSLYNTYQYSLQTQRMPGELSAATAEATPSTGGMSHDDILRWSYGRQEMLTFIVPDAKGGAGARPEGGSMALLSLAALDDAQIYRNTPTEQLLMFLPQYFNDSESTNGPVYPGVIITALFLLGCFTVKGPLKWALVAGTAVSMLLSLGYNAMWLSDWMIYHFPMYNKFRAVESILVVAEFTMPLLGILGLCAFIEAGDEAWSRYGKAFAGSFGVCALVAAAAAFFPGLFGPFVTGSDLDSVYGLQSYVAERYIEAGASQAQLDAALYDFSLDNPRNAEAISSLRRGLVSSDGLRSLLFLLLAAGALGLWARKRCSATVALIFTGVLIFNDLYTVDKRYVSHSSFGPAVDPESHGIAPDEIDLAIMADSTGHYRVLDIPGFSDARRSYFHSMVGGYHAAKLSRTNEIVNRKLVPAFARYGWGYGDSIPAPLRSARRIANMLNAKYIITGDRAAPVLRNTSAAGNAWFVDSIVWTEGADAEFAALDEPGLDIRTTAVADNAYRKTLGTPSPIAAGDCIALTDYTPNCLTYNYSSTLGGVAVFSEVYFPWGWKVSVDGESRPLGRVNYFLRAVAVPPGSHTVTMTFDPDSLHVTGGVAYACVTLIYLLLFAGIFVECRRWKVF